MDPFLFRVLRETGRYKGGQLSLRVCFGFPKRSLRHRGSETGQRNQTVEVLRV